MKKLLPILLLLFSTALQAQQTDTVPGTITSITMQVTEQPNNNPYAERDSVTGIPFPIHMVSSEVNVNNFNHIKGADVKLGKTAGSSDLLMETYLLNHHVIGNNGSCVMGDGKLYITAGPFEHRDTYYLQVQLIYDDDSRSASSSASAE